MRCDVLVLGAGPAGCAAAISARHAGLSVIMLEAQRVTRPAPGESLPPGIEAIFKRLNIWDGVTKAGFHRHRGIWKCRDEHREFVPYGADDNGPWLGLQAERQELHRIFQDAASAAGAVLLRGTRPKNVLRHGGRVTGVELNGGTIEATWVLDATGRRAWLARALRLHADRCLPRVRVCFGWTSGDDPHWCDEPLFQQHEDGWDWRAPLHDRRSAWAKLRFDESRAALGVERAGGIDMTSRLCRPAAGAGYFLLGDAAMLLDPAAPSGILRAQMSSMLAVHLIVQIMRGETDELTACKTYLAWLEDSFTRLTAQLHDLYFREAVSKAVEDPPIHY